MEAILGSSVCSWRIPLATTSNLNSFSKCLQYSCFTPPPIQNSASNRRKFAVPRAGESFLELIPELRKESLRFDLPMYDSSKRLPVDLVVVGTGPAGLSVAQRVCEAGLSVVCIDPSPQSLWPNNYGVWADEFEAIGLLDCLDPIWPDAVVNIDERTTRIFKRSYGRVNRKLLKTKMMEKCISNGVEFHQAKVIKVAHDTLRSTVSCNDGVAIRAALVLDATGFSRCLVEYNKPYDPAIQIAYGILAEVEEHPFDVDKMLLMDWRDAHLRDEPILRDSNWKVPTFLYAMPISSNVIFLEETSLVARPALSVEEVQKRMVARLKHLGIHVKSIEEDETCVIHMGGVLPAIPQRVLGIGGTAGMVHPSTGYMVARTLTAAPSLADSIVQCLGSAAISRGDNLSEHIWNDLWPSERRMQREFFCLGMEILLQLDLGSTRKFFEAFSNLESHYQQGFLSSRLFFPDLIYFGLSMLANGSNQTRLDMVTKSAFPLLKMIKNLMTV